MKVHEEWGQSTLEPKPKSETNFEIIPTTVEEKIDVEDNSEKVTNGE